uniref:glycerate kinase family protein n=1 Tax=Alistipes sp. TaxID=1872444 RepID=UPI004056C34C
MKSNYPSRILIAIDSLKGSLSSQEAASAIEEALHAALPATKVRSIAIADGGEGLMATLHRALGGEFISCPTHDPLMRPISASFLLTPDHKTALVESAAASGLTLLSMSERNPLKSSSQGTGELLVAALEKGVKRVILGLGGTATNDAGIGLLRALGVRLYDSSHKELLGAGEALERIVEIDLSGLHPAAREVEWILACDVENPLCGPQGATYTYGPQKGADEGMVERLEAGMCHYARCLEEKQGLAIHALKGGGAAGGIAASMVALLGARMERGFDLVARYSNLKEAIHSADLVITGEGRIDHQTASGKAPQGVARLANEHGVPCIALCGSCAPAVRPCDLGFQAIYPTRPEGMHLEEAMRPTTAKENLRRATLRMVRELFLG